MNYIKNYGEDDTDFKGVLGDIVSSFDDEMLDAEADN
jgi:hypothetical protein